MGKNKIIDSVGCHWVDTISEVPKLLHLSVGKPI